MEDFTLPQGIRKRAAATDVQPPETTGYILHSVATVALLTTLVVWAVSRGALPAADPGYGALLTILHMGAWMTGWLGLSASMRAWRAINPSAATAPELAQRATMIGAAGATCALGLLINTVLVMMALA
jgi:hypothetical protein